MTKLIQNGRIAVLNLFLLIGAGISVSWWVLYYTDAFPVFGGILGLGGLFSWIAFVGNILTDERKQQIQTLFDQCFLQKWQMLLFLFVFLVAWWMVFAPTRSTLVVDSLESVTGRVMEVREYLEKSVFSPPVIRRIKLSPRSKAKVLLSTPWFASDDYYVKVSGFPARKITVSGYRRETLFVPKLLLERPVVLIRPAARDAGPVSKNFSLEVLIDHAKKPSYTIAEYRGQSLWLGVDDDVDVPRQLVDRWRLEFKVAGIEQEGVSSWLPPLSLAPEAQFSGSSVITVNLKNKDNTVKYTGEITIDPSGKARQFPEEIVLHEK